MVRSIGAQIGLLAFAVAVIAGLYAGNSVTLILTRALVAMVIGSIIGQIAGWGAKLVLRDYLQKKKTSIDREHIQAMQALNPPAAAEDAEPIEVS